MKCTNKIISQLDSPSYARKVYLDLFIACKWAHNINILIFSVHNCKKLTYHSFLHENKKKFSPFNKKDQIVCSLWMKLPQYSGDDCVAVTDKFPAKQ